MTDLQTITESDEELERILAAAELPALLPALAYATGDLSILGDHLRPNPMLAQMPQGGLSDDQQAEIRAIALEKLIAFRDGGCVPAARPSDDDVLRIMEFAVSGEGRGLAVTQLFFNENRIRQAASSLGAAQFCIDQAIEYAKERKPFGKALATNQGIQFPLVELQAQCDMLRALIHKTAWEMDTHGAFAVSDKVSMCNYTANRLCCDAADLAMQVHGGIGYSRHKAFEHIYRHHRRYRITEGADEIQMRRIAGYLFGFMGQQAPKGVDSVKG